MPTKKRLTKQDITQAHIIDSTKEHNPLLDYLTKHHPETLSEERLNLKALEQSLGFSPSSMQGYELSFIGKPLANALYSTPTTKELKELDPKHSQNIIIKGDNLHALKLLKSAYDNKIKMIYIDPPYNTKSEKFIYDDNFIKEYQKLLIELDLLKLDSNAKVLEKSEVLHFLTNPSGDKSHSGWLSFMYPRLKLARDLLKDDGVIFISIDDNEQANLKILCDEIFGEENFINCLSVENNPKGRKNDKFISVNSEFVLIYAKNKKSADRFNNIVAKNKEDMLQDKEGYYTQGQRVLVGNSSNKVINDANSDKNYVVYYNISTNDMIVKRSELKENLSIINKGYKRYASINCNGDVIENTYTFSKLIELYNSNSLIFNDNTIYEKDRNMFKQQKSLIVSTEEWDLKTESAGFKDGNFDLKKIFSMPKNPNFIKMLIKMVKTTSTNTGGGGGRYSA
ncbi:site-specific DNA-methyltransferase [Campylobacter upsaliensis]|uniref:site-specific DNA-methyltransferase n=1 Tax=Campylobacter upsaliensis TaxID=28080 RepID=UPI002B3BDFA4|nr:site-specific DNA-methyltransferase [Campylobacter upsaliensis]MEB2788297.1 site-specific DNA-methyltransferase [Campylobacter upsaliensis]MEB2797365.1 site-specific DNA-methyltransferase [Campylobacter upsaliensis]